MLVFAIFMVHMLVFPKTYYTTNELGSCEMVNSIYQYVIKKLPFTQAIGEASILHTIIFL